jgi:hypothetical protein
LRKTMRESPREESNSARELSSESPTTTAAVGSASAMTVAN